MRRGLVEARWREVTRGPVNAGTTVLAVDGATLTVGVANEAWRQRMEREKPYLLEAFGPLPGGASLARIRFVVHPAAVRSDERPDLSGAGRGPREGKARRQPETTLRGGGAAALAGWPVERLPELRAAFEAWVRASSRNDGEGEGCEVR